MTNRTIVVSSILIVAALAAACRDKAAAGGSCDPASKSWKQTSTGACGESQWKFAKRADGKWDAQETGCAGATGVAYFEGANLVVDFSFPGGKGRYSWPLDAECKPGAGTVSWSEGSLKGQSAPTTLAVAK